MIDSYKINIELNRDSTVLKSDLRSLEWSQFRFFASEMKEEKSSQSLNGHHADCALIPSNGLFGIGTFFFPLSLSSSHSLSLSDTHKQNLSHFALSVSLFLTIFSSLSISLRLSHSILYSSLFTFSIYLTIESSTYNEQQIKTISFQVSITNVFINEAQIKPFKSHRNKTHVIVFICKL